MLTGLYISQFSRLVEQFFSWSFIGSHHVGIDPEDRLCCAHLGQIHVFLQVILCPQRGHTGFLTGRQQCSKKEKTKATRPLEAQVLQLHSLVTASHKVSPQSRVGKINYTSWQERCKIMWLFYSLLQWMRVCMCQHKMRA